MNSNIEKILGSAFYLLSKAASRKKVYSQKARKEGREDLSHLLRAVSESELTQSRRLLHSIRGKIDLSEDYVSTIFEEELEEIIQKYTHGLHDSELEKNTPVKHAFTQLKAVEKHIRSFYSKEAKDISVGGKTKYFVCNFCGYINTMAAPESCPICGALKKDFREVV